MFLAASGFEYHGPNGHLGFAPRIQPEQFKAAFTAAEGWGTFSQQAGPTGYHAEVAVKWGKLRLRSLSVELLGNLPGNRVRVTAGGHPLEPREALAGTRLTLSFNDWVELGAYQRLEVAVG